MENPDRAPDSSMGVLGTLATVVLSLSLAALAFSALGLVAYLSPLFKTRYQAKLEPDPKKVSVQVLVLGDVGRSPRMQYHAMSIAQHGGRVELIGYMESPLLSDLTNHPGVRIHALPPPPASLRSLPFIVGGPAKVLWQIGDLWVTLCHSSAPTQWLLVQNPPTIPTLLIAGIVCSLRGTSLVIDWHNYGWSILAGTIGGSHPFVRIAKVLEVVGGHFSTANLTVTHAMSAQLRQWPYSLRTPIVTMHDRPAAIFRPATSGTDRKELLARILGSQPLATSIALGHTRLIVSSTSWTPDEDFSILLDALVRYAANHDSAKQKTPTPLAAVITGKGPQKDMYMARVAALQKAGVLPGVIIQTAFLPLEDYAALLAAADLGVCLHKSSSGVDLPMKIVDMFGVGLPVAAYSAYESFPELVKEGHNGCGFVSSDELAELLARLLQPMGQSELKILRRGAAEEGSRRWSEAWDAAVAPLLGFQQ